MPNRQEIMPLYKEYVENGGKISPMNTEPCRRYLQEQTGESVASEDVLWLFYHAES